MCTLLLLLQRIVLEVEVFRLDLALLDALPELLLRAHLLLELLRAVLEQPLLLLHLLHQVHAAYATECSKRVSTTHLYIM